MNKQGIQASSKHSVVSAITERSSQNGHGRGVYSWHEDVTGNPYSSVHGHQCQIESIGNTVEGERGKNEVGNHVDMICPEPNWK